MEETDGEVCEWLVRNALDVGLTAECSTDLHGEVIAEDDFVVVVGRRHRLASTRLISIRELADQPFIMSGAGCEPTIRSFFADVACTPRVAFTVRDMTTPFEMVRQGLGVTVVPSLSLPSDRANLRVLELKPTRRRTLLAVTKTPQPLVPAAEAFLGLLRQSQPQAAGGALRG